MLDIKFVRNNPDVVKQNIKNKFQDEKLPLVDEVIELDQKNHSVQKRIKSLNRSVHVWHRERKKKRKN